MTDDITLEEGFIDTVTDECLGPCDCGATDCVGTVTYKLAGKECDYFIDHESTLRYDANIVIRLDLSIEEVTQNNIIPVVYRGLCRTNMDLATVLETVIK